MAMPTKNIAASIRAIAPSFRGGLSFRVCLSKSSWSYRFIFEVPKFVHRKRSRTDAVPLTTVERTFGSVMCIAQRPGTSFEFPDFLLCVRAPKEGAQQWRRSARSTSTSTSRLLGGSPDNKLVGTFESAMRWLKNCRRVCWRLLGS